MQITYLDLVLALAISCLYIGIYRRMPLTVVLSIFSIYFNLAGR